MMEKRIANILSVIAHPLLIPFLGLLVISHSGTYAADLDPRLKLFIYASVIILTCLVPLSFLPVYYFTRIVKNLQLTEKRERVIPLYFTLIFYLVAYFLVRKLPVSQVYQRYLFAACLAVLLVLAITYFWKISAHMVGWGGLVGLITSLSIRFDTDLMLYLIISILASGFIAFARLRLNAHNPNQVYVGFLVGYFTVILVFFI